VTHSAEDVRVRIPVEVVEGMIGLLEDDQVAWPIAGALVLRILKTELQQIDGPGCGDV
jgi:hypothetical protein